MLAHFDPETGTRLFVFGLDEKYNTQSAVTGFTANPSYDRNDITLGLTLKPADNVAFKMDYQFFNNETDVDAKMLNVGVGYQFN